MWKPACLFLLTSLLFSGCSNQRSSSVAVTVLPADLLPQVLLLPDPFLMQDGQYVKTKADWQKRRQELKALFAAYEYGHMPPVGSKVSVVIKQQETLENGVIKRHIELSVGPDNMVPVNVGMMIPPGKGPFPVILRNDAKIFNIPVTDDLLNRGYMVVDYNRLDLDPDKNGITGPAQMAYPDYDWATLAVWAWGGMRVIDYLVTLDTVDPDKIVFTGHSRGGKTALLAGAMDERIAITVPNGSGCGGAGCFRFENEGCETLEKITDPARFEYWFVPRFREFAGKETHLPFDQHCLRALVAPRGLLSVDSVDDRWANPYGTQQSYSAAMKVYQWLGVPQKQGIYFRQGKHEQNAQDWAALADFADWMFYGKTPKEGRRFDRLVYDTPQLY